MKILFLMFTFPLLAVGQNCPMKIWVFDSLERCDSVNPPNAVGTLYADGTCRTIQTDTAPNTREYNMFPGNYRATCTDNGQIRFSDSGCLADNCAVPLGADGVCLRDFSLPGALFSRLSPPEYDVQQERNAGTGGFYTCYKLDGSESNPITVTFVIFGDCSTCDPSAPTYPEIPTPAPVFSIPTAPFSFPSPTFGWEKTDAPTITPTTAAPTTAVPSLRPTVVQSTGTPTFAPVEAGEPTRPPVTPAPVTNEPSLAPTMPPSEDNTRVDLIVSESISVALDLTPMTDVMSEGATQVFVDAAAEQIKLKTQTVRNVGIVDLNQVIQEEDGETLRVSFALLLEYTGDAPALEIFLNAFGTEQARSNLLLQLVQSDDEFEMLRLIEVAGGAPTVDPIDKGNSTSKALLAGSVGAVATFLIFVLLFVGCVVRKRRNVATKRDLADLQIDEHGGKTQAPSSGGDKQKYTNEIVVDTEADDISTLGGSIPGGGATVGDEPTASVNLDYDFERKQYIVDGDTNTAFTSFSALSKAIPTASVFADDDGSFEQQYAEIQHGTKDKKIRPFEVTVPPGLLGMVVDAPNGGVPVVQAIKPESILVGQVQIGDRLIAVDHQDVTRMTAIDVSNMISHRQDKTRILVFVRLGR